jgi:uncharacterized protein (DUF305 family)
MIRTNSSRLISRLAFPVNPQARKHARQRTLIDSNPCPYALLLNVTGELAPARTRPMDQSMHKQHYRTFGIMIVLHFIAMYVLMYAMVHDLSANVYNSVNQFYMAGLMTSSMIGIELLLMGSMYPNKRLNTVMIAVSVLAVVGFWLAIRQQVAVGDKQFVRSMIPHHSGAILMCEQASIKDPELRQLCSNIIKSQQSEIDQMRVIMGRLNEANRGAR